MSYRRGFKAEANWYAREMRRELKLEPDSPLCPWKLADHLGFPVIPLAQYRTLIPEPIAYFESEKGRREFSAITLFVGTSRFIVNNNFHDPKRQASDIAHELAHGILLHPPKPPVDHNGNRHYNSELEDEANWLVREITGKQRRRLYSYVSYLQLLNEGTAPLGTVDPGG